MGGQGIEHLRSPHVDDLEPRGLQEPAKKTADCPGTHDKNHRLSRALPSSIGFIICTMIKSCMEAPFQKAPFQKAIDFWRLNTRASKGSI